MLKIYIEIREKYTLYTAKLQIYKVHNYCVYLSEAKTDRQKGEQPNSLINTGNTLCTKLKIQTDTSIYKHVHLQCRARNTAHTHANVSEREKKTMFQAAM